jgi:hypothetical protein
MQNTLDWVLDLPLLEFFQRLFAHQSELYHQLLARTTMFLKNQTHLIPVRCHKPESYLECFEVTTPKYAI